MNFIKTCTQTDRWVEWSRETISRWRAVLASQQHKQIPLHQNQICATIGWSGLEDLHTNSKTLLCKVVTLWQENVRRRLSRWAAPTRRRLHIIHKDFCSVSVNEAEVSTAGQGKGKKWKHCSYRSDGRCCWSWKSFWWTMKVVLDFLC